MYHFVILKNLEREKCLGKKEAYDWENYLKFILNLYFTIFGNEHAMRETDEL